MAGRVIADVTLDNIDDFFQIGKSISNAKVFNRSSQREQPLLEKQKDVIQHVHIPSYKQNARHNNPNQVAYAEHYQKLDDDLMISQMTQVNLQSGINKLDLSAQNNRPLSSNASVSSASVTAPPGRPRPPKPRGMEDVESVTTAQSHGVDTDGNALPDPNIVYQHYKFDHNYSNKLAITSHHEEIISTIESNQVTVIQGATGSGKTTQVPQYILDHYASKREFCNIVVTQPRRIAAISIARRVCSERSWNLGGICGYQIGMERQMSEDTRILYCTTGVLLAKLINEKTMQRFTHVILDEVHERDQESDFCLLVVRKLLRTNSRDVKVILMSATFDTEQFAQYFSIPVRGQMEAAPVYSVEGRSYAVSEFYVEDLETLGPQPPLKPDDPTISKQAYALAHKLILEFDNLEAKEQGLRETGFAAKRGSVLVFLPGLGEIQDFHEYFEKCVNKHRLWILPLHSTITGEEQVKVFDKPNFPERKVILATNIAESSITVPDIKYVVDFCLTKNLMCDADTNYTSLQLAWAAKANCDQRKGRAGRVSNGRVYRMVTRKFYDDAIPEYGIPEFQRCPLDHLVLQAKLLEMGEPKAILGLALSPPYLDDIERTILQLKEIGALTSLEGGAVNPHDGSLTFMGRVLAALPVDIRVGKLILLGQVFGLLEECIIIAAALSLRSFFSRPYGAELEAYKSKLAWAGDSLSDCIALVHAYNVWAYQKREGVFERNRQAEMKWGRENFIQIRRIKDVEILVKELSDRLARFNLRVPRDRARNRNMDNLREDEMFLKIVMCGAFYPNYFARIKPDEEQAVRTMSGHNPFTTVMVKGLPANQGAFYRDKIVQLFKPCQAVPDPKVFIEETKAYVQFSKDSQKVNGAFSHGVYLALKMRQLRLDLKVELYGADDTEKLIKQVNEMKLQQAKEKKTLRTNRLLVGVEAPEEIPQVKMPDANQTVVELFVTEVVHCGHFWAHYGDKSTWDKMLKLHTIIANRTDGLAPMHRAKLKPGAVCLALFQDDAASFYRAKIIKVDEQAGEVVVFYLDYGNTGKVAVNHLRKLDEDLKTPDAQAIEVQLSGIRPCSVKCPYGHWTPEAKRFFAQQVMDKKLYGKIYSVVHGILRIELFNESSLNINQYLIDQSYADSCTEGFFSMQNHDHREDIFQGIVPDTASQDWLKIADVSLQDAVRKGDLTKESEGSALPRRKREVILSGPSSAHEMQFSCMNNMGRMRTTRIERDSINSVTLDDRPEDPHQRLLVAAVVTLNPSGSTLLARDSTIMPDIPGFPALMALLFCPTIELRTDKAQTKYTGAVCGLGWDPETGGSALPEHDMELVFDVEMEQDDLQLINLVRMAINVTIGGDEREAQWAPSAVLRLQQKARTRVIDLITRKRRPIPPIDFRKPLVWNLVREEDLLRPKLDSAMAGGTDMEKGQLLNLHAAVNLKEIDPETLESERQRNFAKKVKYRKYIEDLHKKAGLSVFKEEIQCRLCDVFLKHPKELKVHLMTRKHREEETKWLL